MKISKVLGALAAVTTFATVPVGAQVGSWALGCTGGGGSISRLVTDLGTVSWANRGWINSGFGHSGGNDNYYTGEYGGSFMRSFFVFDVGRLGGATTATLELTNACQNDAGTFVFSGINNPGSLPSWTGSFPASPYFNQVASGGQYGTYTTTGVGGSSPNNLWSIALGGSAVADLNAAAGGTGVFGIGGAISTDVPISTVPEPASIVLVAAGVASLAGFSARRRKQI